MFGDSFFTGRESVQGINAGVKGLDAGVKWAESIPARTDTGARVQQATGPGVQNRRRPLGWLLHGRPRAPKHGAPQRPVLVARGAQLRGGEVQPAALRPVEGVPLK